MERYRVIDRPFDELMADIKKGGDIWEPCAFDTDSIADAIDMMNDNRCVEIYQADEDGDFLDGSDYDDLENFIKTSIRRIRTKRGVSRAEFSRLYKIPLRTLENWESGDRTPATYVIRLLERAVKEDLSEKKWFIVDNNLTYGAAIFDSEMRATTREDAEKELREEWDRLTKSEQSHRDEFYAVYGYDWTEGEDIIRIK